jgi:membrane-associated phospholipid phosphatase
MRTLLGAIQSVDVRIYYWLSQFHGNWFLDRLASHLEADILLKSGIFVSIYWYFWLREGRDQQERRNTVLAILAGAIGGVVIARMLAIFAPFRLRPMHDASLHHHPFSMLTAPTFVDWSSFPSDTAAYLGALGFGLVRLSRRLAVPVTLYLAVAICLPRLYLGIHFASDVVVGTLIGIASVWAMLQIEGFRSRVAHPLLTFMEATPQIFYPAAFLFMYEMASGFANLQDVARALVHAASAGPQSKPLAVGLILLGCMGWTGIAVRRRFLRRPSKPADYVAVSSVSLDLGELNVVGSGISAPNPAATDATSPALEQRALSASASSSRHNR